MVYLDWAATSIPRDGRIKESLEKSLINYGNPSSVHTEGINAKTAMDSARENCAKLLNCNFNQIYFTSGGTESNNQIILSFLKKHLIGEIITTSIEHPSVMEPISILDKFGWKVKKINPGLDGIIPIKKLEKSITENTKTVSLIYVHNETGVIQPIKDFVKLIREKEIELNKKIFIHIDGVQAVGKIKIDLNDLDVDGFSISGHKFGAPKGVGILYLKNPRDVLYRGGGQEKGIRPGTENLFGILALNRCLEDSLNEFEKTNKHLDNLMNILISGIRNLGASTIPKTRELSDINFVPNILSLTLPPLPGEVLARVLNQKGFMISTGSACSSNKTSTTKGILSMGISEKEGFSSFRISIGFKTTNNDIKNLLKALEECINELAP